MKKPGRPNLKPSIPMVIWLMVELLRDRKEAGRERATERDGCKRLEKHLAECFLGGRVLVLETIRRHYKEFKKVARSNSANANRAKVLLDRARQRREVAGWNVSTWALVLDPDDPSIAKRLSTAGELMTH